MAIPFKIYFKDNFFKRMVKWMCGLTQDQFLTKSDARVNLLEESTETETTNGFCRNIFSHSLSFFMYRVKRQAKTTFQVELKVKYG